MSGHREFARFGSRRLAAGETSTVGEIFYAMQAIDGDAILGTITVAMGDVPTDGDVLVDGAIKYGPFTSIQCKSGSSGHLDCYLDKAV